MLLQGKKIAIISADWFEESEVLYPQFRLMGEGAEVEVLSVGANPIKGKGGLGPIPVQGDAEKVNLDDYDGVVVPGGFAPDMVRRSAKVLDILRAADEKKKPLAFICHGLWTAVSADILNGRTVTAVPVIKPEVTQAGARWSDERVFVDGNLVTGQIPKDLEEWMKRYIEVVSQG